MTTERLMSWPEAVEAMRRGAVVRRKSESTVKLIGHTDEDVPIFEGGEEACRLMHAWTDDERPALVFMGAGSKCLFVPDAEHRMATDWIIVKG